MTFTRAVYITVVYAQLSVVVRFARYSSERRQHCGEQVSSCIAAVIYRPGSDAVSTAFFSLSCPTSWTTSRDSTSGLPRGWSSCRRRCPGSVRSREPGDDRNTRPRRFVRRGHHAWRPVTTSWGCGSVWPSTAPLAGTARAPVLWVHRVWPRGLSSWRPARRCHGSVKYLLGIEYLMRPSVYAKYAAFWVGIFVD